MKLAIPSETADCLAATRSGHFGHCPYFTIVTIEDGEIKSAEAVKNVDHDSVGCGGVIDFALTLGIDGILTVGMGRPPLMRFAQAGVAVYTDATCANVGDAAKLFAAGKVRAMRLDEACIH